MLSIHIFLIINSTRRIEGIPECNSSLKLKDIANIVNIEYASLFIDPIIKILEALNIYYNEHCPG